MYISTYFIVVFCITVNSTESNSQIEQSVFIFIIYNNDQFGPLEAQIKVALRIEIQEMEVLAKLKK